MKTFQNRIILAALSSILIPQTTAFAPSPNEYVFYKKAIAPARSVNRVDYIFLPKSKGNCSSDPTSISAAIWKQHSLPGPGSCPSKTAVIVETFPGRHLDD